MSEPTAKSPLADFEELLALLPLGSEQAVDDVRARDAQLTKPAGSLGELEKMVEHLARWQENGKPTLNNPMVAIFAGNHGVTAQGVSAFPPEVTVQMVANFTNGGAAISQLCALHELNLRVFELALELPTGDFTQEAAMDGKTCAATLAYGMEAIAGKPDLLCIGEMGIGNTTSAAAVYAALFGGSGEDWVGRGTGVDDEGLARKASAVDRGLELHKDHLKTPFDALARLGGREIAAMAGFYLQAAESGVPVLVDGFIASAAALSARMIEPSVTEWMLASHVSEENGHALALHALGLSALIDFNMRLGEGSGAALVVPLLQSAIALHLGDHGVEASPRALDADIIIHGGITAEEDVGGLISVRGEEVADPGHRLVAGAPAMDQEDVFSHCNLPCFHGRLPPGMRLGQ